MFIAHLPAGYLLTRVLTRKHASSKVLFFVGLLGSILPDLDLLYFYLVDGRQNHHHLYWPHVPIFWVLITATALAILHWLNAQRYSLYVWVFALNICLHLILDSVVGGILWLYPVSMELFQLYKIPGGYNWWVANFIWHWSFVIELLICYWALLVYSRQNRGLARQLPKRATTRQAKA